MDQAILVYKFDSLSNTELGDIVGVRFSIAIRWSFAQD